VAARKLKIWYDKEGDFLEVMFGKVLGFSIMRVSALQGAPLEVTL